MSLCIAIIFAVLSSCDKRVFEVKHINTNDPEQSAVAIDYFKKYHVLAPDQQSRPASEHALGL